MKRLIKKESAKQVGTIYHFTSIDNLIKIIKQDALIPSATDSIKDQVVSFTRDERFANVDIGIGAAKECCLIVDGDRLSNKYKSRPYSEFNSKESETIFYTKNGVISPIMEYVIGINIYTETLSGYSREKYIQKYNLEFGEGIPEQLKDVIQTLVPNLPIEIKGGNRYKPKHQVERIIRKNDLDDEDWQGYISKVGNGVIYTKQMDGYESIKISNDVLKGDVIYYYDLLTINAIGEAFMIDNSEYVKETVMQTFQEYNFFSKINKLYVPKDKYNIKYGDYFIYEISPNGIVKSDNEFKHKTY